MSQTNPVVNTYTPDSLIAGDFPIATDAVQIAANQTLARGAVLGVDGTGKYKLSLAASDDGSEAPVAVLLEGIATVESPAPGVIMLTGEVLGDALEIGTGHTADSVKEALRPLSIFVR